jgi:hypothetical protein
MAKRLSYKNSRRLNEAGWLIAPTEYICLGRGDRECASAKVANSVDTESGFVFFGCLFYCTKPSRAICAPREPHC